MEISIHVFYKMAFILRPGPAVYCTDLFLLDWIHHVCLFYRNLLQWILTCSLFHTGFSNLVHYECHLSCWNKLAHTYGLVKDCSISIASALEILQSCTKPLICPYNSTVGATEGYHFHILVKLSSTRGILAVNIGIFSCLASIISCFLSGQD